MRHPGASAKPRTLEVVRLETNTPNTFVKVSVRYVQVTSMAECRSLLRGYWVQVDCVEIDNKGGVEYETYAPFSSKRVCLLESNRFNAATLERTRQSVLDSYGKTPIVEMIDEVAAAHNVTLKTR